MTPHTQPHLAQNFPARGPPETLAQAVQEPQEREEPHRGGSGEEHVDDAHGEEADGEEPAGTHMVRQHAADELADGIGQRLAAGDQAWRCKRGDWL